MEAIDEIIYGYEDGKFLTSQPWKCNPEFPPATLTFDTWEELGEVFHMCFYYYEKVNPVSDEEIIAESLKYAIDLFENPSNYSYDFYGIGPEAYKNWLGSLDKQGNSHGNWWNANVWGECRQNAAIFIKNLPKFSRL